MDVIRAYLATRQFVQEIPRRIQAGLGNPNTLMRLREYSSRLDASMYGSSNRQPSHFEIIRTEEPNK